MAMGAYDLAFEGESSNVHSFCTTAEEKRFISIDFNQLSSAHTVGSNENQCTDMFQCSNKKASYKILRFCSIIVDSTVKT